MSKFKVGDKVEIAKRSIYYGFGQSNPKDMVGEVINTNHIPAFPLRVKWENGRINVYDELDLIKKEKTMDNLQIGDTVVKNTDWGRETFTVEGKFGQVYIGFDEGENALLCTAKELVEQEFELPSEVLEVTVAEVSKKFGKTVKIVEE